MSYVLGLDLGTSGLKGLLVNKQGEVVCSATANYSIETPQSGFSEQDPENWIKAAEKVLAELIKEQPDILEYLEGISFSGQMHSLVVLNKEKQILRNAILWNDVRTTEQCQQISEIMGDELLEITKNAPLEGFTLPKILWLQENEPELWQEVEHMLLPKDYLGFWMTDTIHMDYSDAAGTLLLDVEGRGWSWKIVDIFGIKREMLAELVHSGQQIGVLKKELCHHFGFKNEVRIFAGGADNACAAIGAGVIDEGLGMCSIGTSGVFLSFEKESKVTYAGNLHVFNHVLNNSWYSMGVTLAAGHSLAWFKENFAEESSYEEMLKGIDAIEPGSEGLLFSPYIVGERTPYADSQIRGSFIGLDANHTLKHLAKAVLEGITFSLKDSQQLMEQIAHKKFTKIVSVGGGAKNRDWLQIQADVFNTKVVNLEVEQGPGLGAAMIAAVGCQWFEDIQKCSDVFVKYQEEFEPNIDNVEKYKEIYQIYTEVYAATKGICYRLAKRRG
ncbi:xylulokinase [Enterococcus rivorum]|uniref:Xylulose kinase n=1 Tax=Enterococcus rivorum TaxID=762845 RepID=A0A1E5KY40_9ENTE|nr:xylulokinase [Enterococcus rivorum]MBP2099615.1 xylulokinase [Enterococcus rivorum]OEH82753.1 xylulokinase [Enterococcus rivorum]